MACKEVPVWSLPMSDKPVDLAIRKAGMSGKTSQGGVVRVAVKLVKVVESMLELIIVLLVSVELV
jgi:hypothetical protein